MRKGGRVTLLYASATLFSEMNKSPYRDPVIELYMRDVDRSLLRENLKLTPAHRLEKLVRFSKFAATLKRAGRRVQSRVKQ
jgi:hypothetical protein